MPDVFKSVTSPLNIHRLPNGATRLSLDQYNQISAGPGGSVRYEALGSITFITYWSILKRWTMFRPSNSDHVLSAYLHVSSPCCAARSIWALVAMVTFRNRQAALAAVKLKVYFPPSMSMKTPAALPLWGTADSKKKTRTFKKHSATSACCKLMKRTILFWSKYESLYLFKFIISYKRATVLLKAPWFLLILSFHS